MSENIDDKEKQLLSLLEQCAQTDGAFLSNTVSNAQNLIEAALPKNRCSLLESILIQNLAFIANNQHIDVLQRKRKQSVYSDDYGRTVLDKWNSELIYYIKNVFLVDLYGQCGRIQDYPIKESSFYKKYVLSDDDEVIKHWSDFINNDLYRYSDETENNYDPDLSGHDYEQYVAELIEPAGWAVLVTKGSGDHGADIIATTGNHRIAIQCKKYNSPVGNKSVQEAFSAAQFYDCAFGCVVSNTDFTPAARQAAAKLQVPLLHHNHVTDYFTTLKNKIEGKSIDDDNV